MNMHLKKMRKTRENFFAHRQAVQRFGFRVRGCCLPPPSHYQHVCRAARTGMGDQPP
ncbi:hypothetical protein SCFA_110029 [anaerobic digester metagenome]|uniref:Uncharacterized protein n=1 Tax=anaerobic digester metagenome TaxID=1263854 RepID=A0A485LZF6_9ZZZZ